MKLNYQLVKRVTLNLCISLFAAGFCALLSGAGIYKYQDENGRWIFADRKPDNHEQDFDEIKIQPSGIKRTEPRLEIQYAESGSKLLVKNPFYAPLELYVKFLGKQEKRIHTVVPSAGTAEFNVISPTVDYEHWWVVGKPKARLDNDLFLFPVGTKGRYKITQAFGGPFSHTSDYSYHALDIAMSVGTDVVAAQSGTVVDIKDDYAIGGSGQYFLDKANYIRIIHDDGTLALYAHTLLGSAVVKPGDYVNRGQKIARSGSTGYSTGPHLHFVVQRNIGMNIRSVKYRVVDNKGNLVRLNRGVWVEV